MIDKLDFFAAHAMVARAVWNDTDLARPELVARQAYEMAHAMVRERERIDHQAETDRRNEVGAVMP